MPMSQLQVLTPVSFHKYNPDWKIVIYLTKQKPVELGKNSWVPDYKGHDYFYMLRSLKYIEFREIDIEAEGFGLKHPIQISDYMRLALIYKYGGLYSDFDVIWLKPMVEFKNIECIGNPEDFETTVCFYNYVNSFHNVSNLISESNGGYLYSLLQEQKNVKPPYDHQDFSSTMINKKYRDLDIIKEQFPRILALRYETFYPYCIYNLEQLYKENDLKPLESKNVMCVHWFNGHELSQEYVNHNGFYKDCSMTSILKREGYL
jgi:hypothetical protein